jgi:hypothetical protein
MKAAALGADAFKAIQQRAGKAWSARAPWDTIYQDAYDYAVPQRRPTSQSVLQNSKLYDMTAPMAAMFFAGKLQRDLFPPGQESFVIEAGPLAVQAITAMAGAEAIKTVNLELDKTAKLMHPFFLTGDWDTSVHEACVDLAMGTTAIVPIKGNASQDPLQFATIPFDQIAIWIDMIGKMVGCDWKQEVERDQIYQMWPDAAWPQEFKDRVQTHPNEEICLHQTYWKDPAPGGGWHFAAWIDKLEAEIIHERYRTQPIAVPRYYRVPGEAYGRGVVLTALPSIRTLNKAQELALKAAAIQMLGIWAYRAGGTFNPNTVRFGPGEFWGMQSTGGLLGPDVQRMDAAGGNLNIANLVISGMQEQVKLAMHDTRLPDYQGTPKAAAEIVGRLRQNADVHIGAFGRLVNEIMPVIVPRSAEILHEHGILSNIQSIDNLLFAVRVRSPMAAALNADRLAAIANYHEIVALIAGQQNVPLYLDIEKVLERCAKGFQIDPDLVPDDAKRKQVQAEMQAAQQQQLQMVMAQEAAKNGTKAMADIATQEAANQRQAA